MRSRKSFIILGVLMLSVSLLLWQLALAKPPLKPGNPGLPGCLAEVEELNELVDELQAEIDELNELVEQLQSQALVPQTGQTECWDTSGAAIPCAGTGQDGELQKGVKFPTPRYIDNGDGTITDSLTGLDWLEDANCIATNYPGFDSDGEVTWQQALDFVAGINDGTYIDCGAGRTDWRVPNIRELHSVNDYVDATKPPFLNRPGVPWWSSTTRDQNFPYTTAFTNGGIFISSDAKDKDNYRVWPVRGGN
jgi:hypothetical protein